ncbi:MAG: hypothetical protein ACYDHH_05310, partial [Solirubrobacteraceae bacterium]
WRDDQRWDFSRPEHESVAHLFELGRRLHAEHGRRPIVLTLEDWLAIFLERHRAALAAELVCPLPVTPVLHTLLNKWGMHQLAREHDVPTPVTTCPTSPSEVRASLEEIGLPLVIKPADPYVPGPPPTTIVTSRQELMAVLDPRVASGRPLNMVLQEYIPGEVDSVWMCNGYFGEDPDREVIFTGRKLRQTSPVGVASLAICEPNDTVATQTRRLMQGVGYRGCVGIGWRFDQRDGLYKLLDVNARVSGVFRLFAGTNAVDVVRACYLDLTGQQIPPTALQPGRKWMLEDDLAAAATELRDGRLTAGGWLRSLRGVQEVHWMAADDPVPGIVWSRGRVRRLQSRAARRMTRAG